MVLQVDVLHSLFQKIGASRRENLNLHPNKTKHREPMLRFVAAIAFVVCASVVSVSAENYLKYSVCTDTIFCRADTCNSTQLPEQQCISAGSAVYQKLACNPLQQACGILGKYSDPFCSVAKSTQAFVCGQCEAQASSASGTQFQSVNCVRKDGVESIQVNACTTENCGNGCTTVIDVPKGKCVESKNKQGEMEFLQFEGAAICTTVKQHVWKSATCSGMPVGAQSIAVGYCINGTKLECHYDQQQQQQGNKKN
jgi:hypothetical protein